MPQYWKSQSAAHDSITWGEGAPDAAGHRVAHGALHPAGQDVEQQAGHRAQALAAGEALARRTANRSRNMDSLRLPEAQSPQKPATQTDLERKRR